MKTNQLTFWFGLLVLVVTISGCGRIISMDDVYEKEGYLVAPKRGTINCPTQFVKSLPSDSSNYELIGVCIAEKSPRRGKNRALKKVNKCACHHNADFTKIIEAKESIRIYQDGLKPGSAFVDKDFVMAEIYRKMNP